MGTFRICPGGVVMRCKNCRKCGEKFGIDDFDPMEGLCNDCYKLEWGELPKRAQDGNCVEGE